MPQSNYPGGPQVLSLHSRDWEPQLSTCAPTTEACKPQLEGSPGSLQLETSPCSNEDPTQPEIKKLNFFYFIVCAILLLFFICASTE